MEGPLELAEGDGQAGESDVAFRARIAQALGLGGEVRGHGGQEIGLVEIECLTELKFEGARSAGGAGKSELEEGGGLAVKVESLRGGYENKACLGGGGFKRRDKRRFEFSGHVRGILDSSVGAQSFYGNGAGGCGR